MRHESVQIGPADTVDVCGATALWHGVKAARPRCWRALVGGCRPRMRCALSVALVSLDRVAAEFRQSCHSPIPFERELLLARGSVLPRHPCRPGAAWRLCAASDSRSGLALAWFRSAVIGSALPWLPARGSAHCAAADPKTRSDAMAAALDALMRVSRFLGFRGVRGHGLWSRKVETGLQIWPERPRRPTKAHEGPRSGPVCPRRLLAASRAEPALQIPHFCSVSPSAQDCGMSVMFTFLPMHPLPNRDLPARLLFCRERA